MGEKTMQRNGRDIRRVFPNRAGQLGNRVLAHRLARPEDQADFAIIGSCHRASPREGNEKWRMENGK
jgi:hypothetical protein